jgi:hypothetical protein
VGACSLTELSPARAGISRWVRVQLMNTGYR